MRYRAKAKTPAGKEATRRRTIRARRQRAGELRERIHFVLNSLDLLGRRGFTVSEISKLLRVALGQIYHWRSGASVPTPAIAERCIEILIATSHIPTGTDRAYRRRLPHPELITVLERTAGLDERHPVRNRWRARV